MIKLHIADTPGKLDGLRPLIQSAFDKAIEIARKDLGADTIDIIFFASPYVIPGLSSGGYSPGPNMMHIRIDPDNKRPVTEEELINGILHESHHCMRWRDPGYGETLGEALVSEGLAALYEEEDSGIKPVYVKDDINRSSISKALAISDRSDHDHAEWFFGTGKIEASFGYSLGYKMCKIYANDHETKASKLITIAAQDIISHYRSKA